MSLPLGGVRAGIRNSVGAAVKVLTDLIQNALSGRDEDYTDTAPSYVLGVFQQLGYERPQDQQLLFEKHFVRQGAPTAVTVDDLVAAVEWINSINNRATLVMLQREAEAVAAEKSQREARNAARRAERARDAAATSSAAKRPTRGGTKIVSYAESEDSTDDDEEFATPSAAAGPSQPSRPPSGKRRVLPSSDEEST